MGALEQHFLLSNTLRLRTGTTRKLQAMQIGFWVNAHCFTSHTDKNGFWLRVTFSLTLRKGPVPFAGSSCTGIGLAGFWSCSAHRPCALPFYIHEHVRSIVPSEVNNAASFSFARSTFVVTASHHGIRGRIHVSPIALAPFLGCSKDIWFFTNRHRIRLRDCRVLPSWRNSKFDMLWPLNPADPSRNWYAGLSKPIRCFVYIVVDFSVPLLWIRESLTLLFFRYFSLRGLHVRQ